MLDWIRAFHVLYTSRERGTHRAPNTWTMCRQRRGVVGGNIAKCGYPNGQTREGRRLCRTKRKSNLACSSSRARAAKVARSQESEEQTQTRLALDAERHAAQRAAETEEQRQARRHLDASVT
ncbi:hypothetical protein MSG28_004038 [Choristoneura fumiferana]|uniref:Uncharacterized protein n=1 Tax=Choristoneura fumiferana TaxID=7141 RepID=A0ACC0KH00_CHOFU|nr:hypothetical protein MSG28_004038 [Choristoneura fumiferana]